MLIMYSLTYYLRCLLLHYIVNFWPFLIFFVILLIARALLKGLNNAPAVIKWNHSLIFFTSIFFNFFAIFFLDMLKPYVHLNLCTH